MKIRTARQLVIHNCFLFRCHFRQLFIVVSFVASLTFIVSGIYVQLSGTRPVRKERNISIFSFPSENCSEERIWTKQKPRSVVPKVIEKSRIRRRRLPIIREAFLDPRFNFTVALLLTNSASHWVGQIYCHCLDWNFLELEPTHKTFRMERFTLGCACKSQRLTHLAFTFSGLPVDIQPNLAVEIRMIPRSDKCAKTFAVCLAPIWGRFKHWLLLVQFVEWHRLMGAEKIFIYHQNAQDPGTNTVLRHYKTREPGFVEVIEVERNLECGEFHICRHEYQLNHCIFRTIHLFHYVALIDIDELLVPIGRKTIPDLLAEYDREDVGSFVFRCRWFPRGDNLNESFHENHRNISAVIERNLPLLRYTTSTHFAPSGHTVKSIVKPEMVRFMRVHHVDKWMKNGTKEFELPPTVAYVRHFRLVETWAQEFYWEALSFGAVKQSQISNRKLLSKAVEVICHTLETIVSYTYNINDNLARCHKLVERDLA